MNKLRSKDMTEAKRLICQLEGVKKDLQQQIEEANKKNEWLKNQLGQLANFNPDWDMLQASQESLAEHMQMTSELQAHIEGVRLAGEHLVSVIPHMNGVFVKDAIKDFVDAINQTR